MADNTSYKPTLLACYIGNIVQAITVNITPLLFVPLRNQFGLSYEQLGRLVLINFITQVTVDIAFSKLVDRYGARRFIVASQMLGTVGLLLFALTPVLPFPPYAMIIAATVVFSVCAGLLELLLSPIVNAIPSDEKAAAMSLLHSFYSWGHLGVVLITTALLFIVGDLWPLIVVIWAIFPLVNTFMFVKAPLAPMTPEKDLMKVRKLIKEKFFIVALGAMFFGAISELCMAQWASAFMEQAIGLPREVGNIAGLSLFALMMAIARTLYGKYGSRINLFKVMIAGSAGAAVMYIIVAVSPWPVLSLVACALCGLSVGLLWPGTVSIAAHHFPLAGASLFALLACGGDSGASLGPWLVGIIADVSTLRVGLGVIAIAPLMMVLCVVYLYKRQKNMV